MLLLTQLEKVLEVSNCRNGRAKCEERREKERARHHSVLESCAKRPSPAVGQSGGDNEEGEREEKRRRRTMKVLGVSTDGPQSHEKDVVQQPASKLATKL